METLGPKDKSFSTVALRTASCTLVIEAVLLGVQVLINFIILMRYMYLPVKRNCMEMSRDQ